MKTFLKVFLMITLPIWAVPGAVLAGLYIVGIGCFCIVDDWVDAHFSKKAH